MDAPISPFDGTILKLPGKLDRLLHHGYNLPKGATDEIPLIKGDLEKIIAITSNLENHHAMKARCWRKEVRELSYDLEDFVDQYEHAVQRIQRWGGRYSSPPYRRLVQEGPPKPTLQFCPWMKEWKIVSNQKERNKRIGERKNKSKDGVVDAPLLSSSPVSTCYRKIKSKAALPWLREKLRLRLWMANEIREFSVRVQEALQRHSSYNLDTIDGSSSSGCIDAYSASGNSTCKEEDTYVGIGAALEKLEELLMAKHDHGHQKLKIVSIVGFGGIGKTTLATELYRKFGLQFECRAFVRTAQKPDVRRIFISMLSQVRPHEPPDNWTVHGLISTIRTHLQDKRYLIIVEDLSATSTWDIVKCALPDSNCCSRILTTTEIEDLALQCCGHEPKYVYKMKPLGEGNARDLFFNSVFGPQHECPPELKEISYDIISKCGGLPLAIVTVASILSSQPATQDQWHYVNNSIGYNLLTNHSLEGMKQVLDLSYNNLPHHLKACILYTCLYEEDVIIYRDDLVNQWIAEGFIQATEGQDKKEIARSSFERLVSGKLILPVDINRNGEVLSCTVHHMVLNLVIRYKSTEENFVTAIHHSQAPTTIADNARRLSLQFGNAADAKAPVNVTLTHVRTLAIWGVFKCLPSVVQFPLLQVLILHFWGNKDSISFDITGISELFRLRYLKVTSNVILKFCTKMRSMQSLETLTINARVSAVPSDIVHLPGLLHLSLPAETVLPNGIGNLTSLCMLGYFDLSSNSMENVQSLRMLTNIEDLQLACSTVEPDNLREKMHFVLNSVFVTLRNLKSLTMVPRASSYAKSIDDAIVVGTTISVGLPSAPALLRCLEVSPRICRFFCLPKWIGQLHKLRVLKFGVGKIDRDGVDILGGLPDLAVLSLYVHMKPEMGIVIGKTGFPVIKYFKFKCCDPCLKFEEGAMPNLRKLKLAFNACNAGQQNTIPVGINYLSELKEVSAKIGGAGPEESNTRAAKSAFRDAIRMHDRIQRVNIQCVKQITFGNDDQSDITPVEDSPRSGEETMHFQNESKQRKEEETEAVADANKAIELDPTMHKAYYRKGAACIKLEEYQTTKAALELGSSYASGDSRFTRLLKECDERIAEESSQAPTKKVEAPVAATVEDKEDVANMENTPPVVEPPSKPKYRHDYYNSPTEVVLTIFAKGVPADSVVIDFGEQMLSVSIEVPGEEPYHFQPRLFAKIIPEKCKYQVLSTKVEIRLAKAEQVTWTTLDYSGRPKAVPQKISTPAETDPRPSYPSSKPKKDWDKLEAEVKKEEKEEKLDGDAALNKIFRDICKDADEDMRRAMMKSFVESNGTVLSTNWKDVGSKKVEGSPPDGMELEKWEY